MVIRTWRKKHGEATMDAITGKVTISFPKGCTEARRAEVIEQVRAKWGHIACYNELREVDDIGEIGQAESPAYSEHDAAAYRAGKNRPTQGGNS